MQKQEYERKTNRQNVYNRTLRETEAERIFRMSELGAKKFDICLEGREGKDKKP